MLRVVEVSVNDDGLDICLYDELTCLAVRFTWLYNQFSFVPKTPNLIENWPLKILLLRIREYLCIKALDLLIRRRRQSL